MPSSPCRRIRLCFSYLGDKAERDILAPQLQRTWQGTPRTVVSMTNSIIVTLRKPSWLTNLYQIDARLPEVNTRSTLIIYSTGFRGDTGKHRKQAYSISIIISQEQPQYFSPLGTLRVTRTRRTATTSGSYYEASNLRSEDKVSKA